ncbi:hypothetical protein C8T65DRAFT_700494 [Cerioporus squamosus]|nr:hypothetical protein C8T65DRAFT_700494 [Cerioporus squamosus]
MSDVAMSMDSLSSPDGVSMHSDQSDTWVDLYNGKEMILSPFHDIAATFPRFDLIWAIENQEGTQTRYVLCHRRQGATPPGRQPVVPLLFDHHGEISRDECLFTASGITAGRSDEDIREAPLASCWLQERPHDKLSNINWRPTESIIATIANTVSGDVDTSMLFRNHAGFPQLKLRWQGFPGETTSGALPIYNEHGIRHVPLSLNSFPFGQAFHAGFTLTLHHDGETDSHSLYANLLRIVRA